jgi:VWFA-related protein
VNRVILDVVVTDSEGRPVHGLARGDFSVTEDNVPQRVMSFDVHNLEKVSESLPPNLPPLPPNTFLNLPKAPEKGPLYVLLVDLVNTEGPDQMWARQELLKFIDAKPEGTRFAVFMLSDGLHLVQGFTGDRELLHAAVDPSHPKHHVPKVFLYSASYGRGDQTLMLSVFQDIVQYLDGLPGRKNLMWMADSFPLSIHVKEGDPFDTADGVKKLIGTMAKAQVAVYTFSAGGLSVDNPHAGASVMPGGQVVPGPSLAALTYLDVSHLTGATGGEAYFENNLHEEFGNATENGATYYTLTYAPSNGKYDGKLRKIGVSLAKRGYKLSYRRSYYADDPNAPRVQKVSAKDEPQPEPPRRPGDSLIANMEYGAPMAHQLVFRAHLQALGAPALGTPAKMANLADQPAYFQVRRKNRPVKPLEPVLLQTYVVDYLVLLPSKAEGEKPLVLELATAAFDDDGTMLNGVVENGTRITSGEPRLARVQGGNNTSGADAGQKGIYRAQQRIDVPVGATTIRVAVRDMNTDRIGAMEVALPLAPEPQTEASAPVAPQGAVKAD